jgi:hypothetical protein
VFGGMAESSSRFPLHEAARDGRSKYKIDPHYQAGRDLHVSSKHGRIVTECELNSTFLILYGLLENGSHHYRRIQNLQIRRMTTNDFQSIGLFLIAIST